METASHSSDYIQSNIYWLVFFTKKGFIGDKAEQQLILYTIKYQVIHT